MKSELNQEIKINLHVDKNGH